MNPIQVNFILKLEYGRKIKTNQKQKTIKQQQQRQKTR